MPLIHHVFSLHFWPYMKWITQFRIFFKFRHSKSRHFYYIKCWKYFKEFESWQKTTSSDFFRFFVKTAKWDFLSDFQTLWVWESLLSRLILNPWKAQACPAVLIPIPLVICRGSGITFRKFYSRKTSSRSSSHCKFIGSRMNFSISFSD